MTNHGDPNGNIWITSRTRMQSHARFSRYDLLSHIVLTAYSVILLAFSVFADHLTNTNVGPYTSEISIVLSLSVLCASLVIWGLKFGKKADEHRECYLSLQRLYDDPQNRDNQASYFEILDRYPNHSEFDYEGMLYRLIWCQGKVLRDREGIVRFCWMRFASFWFLRIVRFLIGTLVVSLPLLFLAFLYSIG